MSKASLAREAARGDKRPTSSIKEDLKKRTCTLFTPKPGITSLTRVKYMSRKDMERIRKRTATPKVLRKLKQVVEHVENKRKEENV